MIRPDPAALAAVHARAFPAPWSRDEFAALLAQPGVLAVVEPDGFILIRVVLDEAEILTLAVRPAARRAGLGGRLVGQAAVAAANAAQASATSSAQRAPPLSLQRQLRPTQPRHCCRCSAAAG